MDRPVESYPRLDSNPHLLGHKEFGRPLIPAEELKAWRGRWVELFGRDAPLVLEIGSGNGDFMVEWARQNPEYNVLGIEIRFKRTVLCARKIRAAASPHVLIARYHAKYLRDLFDAGDLAGIWVNHPDPWPKERHEKHRLISGWFLDDAAFVLRPGGFLRIKSDFAPNCDRVAQLLTPESPLMIVGRADDVNRTGAPWPDDVCTNYQGKMLRAGVPVHAIDVRRR